MVVITDSVELESNRIELAWTRWCLCFWVPGERHRARKPVRVYRSKIIVAPVLRLYRLIAWRCWSGFCQPLSVSKLSGVGSQACGMIPCSDSALEFVGFMDGRSWCNFVSTAEWVHLTASTAITSATTVSSTSSMVCGEATTDFAAAPSDEAFSSTGSDFSPSLTLISSTAF